MPMVIVIDIVTQQSLQHSNIREGGNKTEWAMGLIVDFLDSNFLFFFHTTCSVMGNVCHIF